jgi:hypothetical protein
LRRADHSSKESYRLCKNDYETDEEAWAQQRVVEPLMMMMNYTACPYLLVISFGLPTVFFCGPRKYRKHDARKGDMAMSWLAFRLHTSLWKVLSLSFGIGPRILNLDTR